MLTTNQKIGWIIVTALVIMILGYSFSGIAGLLIQIALGFLAATLWCSVLRIENRKVHLWTGVVFSFAFFLFTSTKFFGTLFFAAVFGCSGYIAILVVNKWPEIFVFLHRFIKSKVLNKFL